MKSKIYIQVIREFEDGTKQELTRETGPILVKICCLPTIYVSLGEVWALVKEKLEKGIFEKERLHLFND